MLLVGVLSLVVGTSTFIGGLLAAPIDFAVAPPPTAALLLAADGRQFATIAPPERREPVSAKDIPQVMREAIISAEDERFLNHSGVDPLATIRAAFRDLTGGVTQGGSTLTQQYVKNAYVGNERSALRKIREAAIAVRLEQKLSKEQILTDYLNALYLGNGLYGVQAASKYYFGVAVKDLDYNEKTRRRDPSVALARASIMAGIAPAPSVWNPVKDFATARVRQQYTLNQMVIGGYVTPQQASDAFKNVNVTPLRKSPPELPTVAPEFTDFVRGRILKSRGYDEDVFFRGGLRVRTTLDLDLQLAFNRAIKEVLPAADDPQAAIVAVDYRNGDVKAMATRRVVPNLIDRDTGKIVRKGVTGYEPKLGFNLATNAQRSMGSTIKPFTLAVALSQGQTLSNSRYAPDCMSIRNPGGTPNPYRFCNSDTRESGRFSLKRAMAHSVNTVYLPLAKEVGRAKVADLAEKAGLRGRIKSIHLSFGIGGGVDVTPLSQAVAYGTFANGGAYISPRTYTEIRSGASGTDPGQVLERVAPNPSRRVVSPSVAADVVDALTSVVTSGTGTAARQPFPVFGKTGTTNDSTDAWFTGCIPDQHLCVATWMGYEYSSCTVGKKSENLKVAGKCGGMKGVHGARQVFGGGLPAKIFARSQEILREIKLERERERAGLPTVTASPEPTMRPRRSIRPTPVRTATPVRTVAPKPTATVAPTAVPTSPPVILPPPPQPTPTPTPTP